MEIQLKVYVYWSSKCSPQIRRLELNQLCSIEDLRIHLHEVIPVLDIKEYLIMWKDAEGDSILICTDKELQVAVKEMPGLVRLHVLCKKQRAIHSDPDFGLAIDEDSVLPPMGNYKVWCNGCEALIPGFRYKCTICNDYDLCASCEGKGLHAEHFMLRIPVLDVPYSVTKAALKGYRLILKSILLHFKTNTELRRRREQNSTVPPGSEPLENCPENHRKRSSGAICNLCMSDFANVPGDVNSDVTKATSQPQPQESGKETTPAPTQQSERESRLAQLENHCKILRSSLTEEEQQSTVQPITSININSKAVGQGDSKHSKHAEASVSDIENVTSDTSSETTESDEEDIIYKVHDWTVINKEKDILGASCLNRCGKETPAPIVFNPPEEFQSHVSVNQEQILYPPLNGAAAVLDLEVAEPDVTPEFAKATTANANVSAAIANVSAATASESTTTANESTASAASATISDVSAGAAKPPEATKRPDFAAKKPNAAKPFSLPPRHSYYPIAHINVALEQMLNMGFTDDDGWLTQLLERKDGDISAVLDLLTPVNPKTM